MPHESYHDIGFVQFPVTALFENDIPCGYMTFEDQGHLSLTACTAACMMIPTCESIRFRPLGGSTRPEMGDCQVILPYGGEPVNYTDDVGWSYYSQSNRKCLRKGI